MRELHQILEALRRLEWGTKEYRDGSYCPACKKCKVDGHKKDCWLASAIAASHTLESELAGI